MTYWVEHRNTKVRYGKLKMVPLEEINNYTGYRSIYAFDEETRSRMEYNNSTANHGNSICYSNLLCVDFDNAEDKANAFELLLNQLQYTKYTSGGRSIHFEISTEPMSGISVPAQHREWMQQNSSGHDESIYFTSAMWRLNGTWHEKNLGNRKEVLYTHKGSPLVINIELTSPNFSAMIDVCEEYKGNLDKVILQPVGEGGRRPHIFKIVANSIEYGMNIDSILELAMSWNKVMAKPPLDFHEVVRYVEKTYDQITKTKGVYHGI